MSLILLFYLRNREEIICKNEKHVLQRNKKNQYNDEVTNVTISVSNIKAKNTFLSEHLMKYSSICYS